MKKTVCLFFIALSTIFNIGELTASAATHSEMKEIKSSGVLRIATEGAFAPFNFTQGGQLTGFEVELGNEIAKKMNLKAEWKTVPFGSILIGIDQGRYDLVISSHAVTPEREKAVFFVSPHYCSGAVIITKKGGPQTIAALAGKTVGTQSTSIYPKFLEAFPSIKEVKRFLRDEDAINGLIADRVDATVTDKFLARDQVKKDSSIQFQISSIINPERNAMAVAKDNKELHDEVEKTLKELMRNGVYEKLSKKYFGEDIRCK